MFFLFAAGIRLASCTTPQPPVASVPTPESWTVQDQFRSVLRQLLADRAGRQEVVRKLGNPDLHRVPSAAYLDTFLPHAILPPGTRAKWKQEYRASARTYDGGVEDGDSVLLFFDGQGHLRWYEFL